MEHSVVAARIVDDWPEQQRGAALFDDRDTERRGRQALVLARRQGIGIQSQRAESRSQDAHKMLESSEKTRDRTAGVVQQEGLADGDRIEDRAIIAIQQINAPLLTF